MQVFEFDSDPHFVRDSRNLKAIVSDKKRHNAMEDIARAARISKRQQAALNSKRFNNAENVDKSVDEGRKYSNKKPKREIRMQEVYDAEASAVPIKKGKGRRQ